ncbi:MAG TPA: GntG family PLP-dependent aldolase [Pyrinomonadaceae bacterium]|nr:GntG family PLP-dependent aldolase [Pyrinomonadaceae bacterium]
MLKQLSQVSVPDAMIDLRSDTVTKPSANMRAAMAAAEVGDDVFGDDPTVNRLQERAAEIFEKEAALWVPTGCMGNEIAVKVHTRPGQEIVAEDRGHILNYELGAAAIISGVTIRPVKSGDGTGHLTWDEIEPVVRINPPYYQAATGLVCLENTHNFAGGSVMTAAECADVCEHAHIVGLPIHMDGARIFNAAVALDTTVSDLTRRCDSVMFTLSKGLGAPAGSILLGTADFIRETRIWRKRLGGGMRQVGILAAAGLIALEEGPTRLHEDHANARALAEGLAALDGIAIDGDRVVTNIVIFDIAATGRSSADIVAELEARGILAIGFGSLVRMVTHLDITADDVATTVLAMQSMCA